MRPFRDEEQDSSSLGGSRAARILGVVLVVASILGGIAHYLGLWK